MFLSTLGASLLGNLLEGTGITRGSERANKAVKDYYVAVKQYNFILLTNFEIQKHYQNKTRFNGAYSRNNLNKIKDGEYVIHLDEYKSIGTNWIALHVNDDSFGGEHILKEIKRFIGNRNITKNIFRIKTFDSIMYWYYCIGLIDFMLKGKLYTSLFSPS